MRLGVDRAECDGRCRQPSFPGSLLAAGLLAACLGCAREAEPGRATRSVPGEVASEATELTRAAPSSAPATPAPWAPPLFTDVTDELGLDFVHDAGLDGTLFLPEIMGSGAAVFDADADGDLDIYLLDGGRHEFPLRPDAARNRLFLQGADRRFVEAPRALGLDDAGYGQGVAVGDVNGDGLPDAYVANYGPDALFLGGAGGFADATTRAGIGDGRWGSVVAFLDTDGDGRLDIFVGNYVAHDPQVAWLNGRGERIYCGPDSYDGEPSQLYRGEGRGLFRDVSEESGIGLKRGKALGVACADLTGDGLVDLFVANDGVANHLWVNQGDGTFREEALQRGLALDGNGRAGANMGVATGDPDGDGDLDLFVTRLWGETNVLFVNDGNGRFTDGTARAGLAQGSLAFTGWGTAFVDVDADGDDDLLIANGRIFPHGQEPSEFIGRNLRRDRVAVPARPETAEGFARKYGERNQLFENLGDGRFVEAAARAGGFGALSEVSRALVTADLDGDLDLDLVVTNAAGRARILRNDAGVRERQIMVRCVRGDGRADARGATVIARVGSRRVARSVDPTTSYLSCAPAVVHFGLGEARGVDSFEVRWPGGLTEEFPAAAGGSSVTLRQGAGRALSAPRAGAPRLAARPADPRLPRLPIAGLTGEAATLVARASDRARRCPEDAEAWGRLGMALHAVKRPVEAGTAYEAAATLDPANARWPYLHAVLADDGPAAPAIARLARASKLAPSSVPVAVRRAALLERAGRRVDAEAAWRRALALDARQPLALVGVARADLDRGNAREAAQTLRVATDVAPRWRPAHEEMARALEALGLSAAAEASRQIARGLPDSAAALEDPWLAEVQALDPSPATCLDRARACVEAGDYRAAQDALDAAIRVRPADASILYQRALVRRELRDQVGCVRDVDAAVAADGRHVPARLDRARARAAAARLHESLDDLDAALAVLPDLHDARILRATVLAGLGRFREAETELHLVAMKAPGNAAITTLLRDVKEQASRAAPPPGAPPPER